MNQTTHPGKERIRQWLRNRQQNPGCLPTMEQIKSELGWTSIKPYAANRECGTGQNHIDGQSA